MGFLDLRIVHGLLHSGFIELYDIFRSAFGGYQSPGRAVPFVIVSQFAQGGNVFQQRIPFFGKQAQYPQFRLVAVDQFGNVGNLGTGEIHFSLAQG